MSKKLILIMMLISGLTVNAQVNEELPERSNEQVQIDFIQDNLMKHYKQYRTGTQLLVFGAGAAVLSGILPAIDDSFDKIAPVGMFIGGALALTGSIVQIDSHKYLGRAAIKVHGDGVSLTWKL